MNFGTQVTLPMIAEIEVVNDFSTLHFMGTRTEYNAIVYAFLKSKDNGEFSYIFTREEFCSRFEIKIDGETAANENEAVKALQRDIFILENGECGESKDSWQKCIPWFSEINLKINGDVYIEFNEKFVSSIDFFVVLEELLEAEKLDTVFAEKYYLAAARCYRRDKLDREDKWWFYLTEKELKDLFNVKNRKLLRRKSFTRKIITVPCKEISKKTSLNIEPFSQKMYDGSFRWVFICSNKECKNTFKENEDE